MQRAMEEETEKYTLAEVIGDAQKYISGKNRE